MFNLDDITGKKDKKHNKKMVIYSRSPVQNINNRRFWVRKSKCII